MRVSECLISTGSLENSIIVECNVQVTKRLSVTRLDSAMQVAWTFIHHVWLHPNAVPPRFKLLIHWSCGHRCLTQTHTQREGRIERWGWPLGAEPMTIINNNWSLSVCVGMSGRMKLTCAFFSSSLSLDDDDDQWQSRKKPLTRSLSFAFVFVFSLFLVQVRVLSLSLSIE